MEVLHAGVSSRFLPCMTESESTFALAHVDGLLAFTMHRCPRSAMGYAGTCSCPCRLSRLSSLYQLFTGLPAVTGLCNMHALHMPMLRVGGFIRVHSHSVCVGLPLCRFSRPPSVLTSTVIPERVRIHHAHSILATCVFTKVNRLSLFVVCLVKSCSI